MNADGEDASRAIAIKRIASVWRAAVGDIAYIPLSPNEVRERFERLAAELLDATASTPAETRRRGRAIGGELVKLNLLRPEALERTLACLVTELNGATPSERTGDLLAGIAGGFTEAAEATLLGQQEAIARAATLALRRAQTELEASRNSLAVANRELSGQIRERIQAEQIQREYAERLQRLHEIDLAILSAESLSAIVDISIEYLGHLIPAVSISMTLLDVVNRRSVILRSTNNAYPTGRDMQVTMVEALERLSEGQIVYLEDLQAIRDRSPGVAEIADLGGRSLLAVPLRYREQLLGSLIIILGQVRPFTEAEIATAREIADSVAVAIQNRRLLEAERAAHEREATLREVAASLTLGLSLDDLLHRILNHLDRVVTNHSSGIFLLENGHPVMAARRGVPGSSEHLNELVRSRPLSLRKVIDTGQPYIINDTHRSPAWTILEGLEYIRAWMGVPLLVKDESIGVLTIDRDTQDAFTTQDLELAMTFANQAAIAIDYVRLLTQLQEHAVQLNQVVHARERDLLLLYEIAATAVENPDLEDLLTRLLQLTADALGCSAAVYLLEGEDEHLRPVALLDGDRPELGELLRGLGTESPLLLRSLQTGAPAFAGHTDLPAATRAEPPLCVATPLRSRGRKLGVLCLAWDDPGRYADVSETLLVTIADQIGTAVENIKLYRITRQTAITEERDRLARDLHDQVTQSIYSAGLFAEAARDALQAGDAEKTSQHIRSIRRVTDQALRELRLLLFELRTEALARRGLVNALRERLRTVEHRVGIAGDVRAVGLENIPIVIEETFYRIALEALNNALRHAHAGRVDITLAVEGHELLMTIDDDGIGFDWEAAAAAGGMGLDGMQKRIRKVNGTLTVTSDASGTRVTAWAPLES